MAFQDMPLSDLDSASSVGDSDLMYIVQGGVSKKATRGQVTSGFAHLVNGTVPLSELPKTALDNLVKVEDDTARFALTTAEVQNGDSVEVLSTNKMYLVVDDTKLNVEAGYREYAATVNWSTIQGKPNNLVKSVPVGTPSGGAMSPILHESDVVDALNSSSTTSPLSANQGKVLKQNVDTLSQNLTELESALGTVVTDGNASVTLPASTYTNIASIQLGKGVWIITSLLQIGASIAGVYIHQLLAGSSELSLVRNNGQNGGGSSNATIVTLSATTTITLRAYIGTATTAKGSITAVRIK